MEGFRSIYEHTVIFRDLDVLGHVNNAVYATYLETGRIEYLAAIGADALGLILAELTVTYRSPAFLREKLLIGTRISEIKNSSFIVEAVIEEKTTGRLVATSRAVIVHYDYAEGRSKPLPPEWREKIAAFEGRSF
ncbi:MAG TPA: thioesterase family protein [Symbiobacteriaceae bacterium]|nr:thioesterase family protein [Symbiobacteriaceae bacterium]